MLCTFTSRLLGIVRARVIGSAFGSGEVGDVINFTYNIPNNFRKLFAEGAMSSSYIPEFSKEIGEGRKRDVDLLMSQLFTWQFCIFLLLDLLAFAFGPELIAFFSNFNEAQVSLGGRLLPFFMVFLTAISLGTIFSGILQCHGQFFASSFAPLIFSVTAIGGILLFHRRLGPMAMGWSVMAGGAFQLIFWYLWIRHLGYRIRPRFRFKGTAFPAVLKNWVTVVSASLVQVCGQQVSYTLASHLEESSVTAYSNATIFWQTPYGIFFTAIATVYFPLMSQAWGRGDLYTLRNEVDKGLSYLATLLVPSAILIFTLSRECVSSLLQTGAFTMEAAMLTASLVRIFLCGMLFVAWYGYLQRFCYSTGRYHLALRISFLTSVLDVIFSFLLVFLGLKVQALALSTLFAYPISLLVTVWYMRDVWRPGKALLKDLSKVLVANIPLLLVCLAYRCLHVTFWQTGSTLKNILITGVLGISGVLVCLASYTLFHIPFLSLLRGRKRS